MGIYISLYVIGSMLGAGMYSGSAYESQDSKWNVMLWSAAFALISWYGVGAMLVISLNKLKKP